ncbi:TetR/AcrR family transcriptional regulator [Marmoricola sp. URHB0036]|uniref:TetR/AcrR family transcriptional regulator n=1 Tax=Marmoricola sp. URHB0036 TaxID=1298863 RepID=UPI000424461D|nr:TetR/AcrR family transcriptional regulator [Marmoricola sp. URHB0036]
MTRQKALRADARRNQQQVLDAARELFIERGLDCPLEEVARRAGVGIGTLYRRFGDREALVKAVLLDALAQSLASAERALGSGEDGLEGVAAYLREMLDVRVSAVIPLALDRLDDPDLERARTASASALQRLVDAAHDDGSLPPEITFGDLGTLLVRLSRPLPVMDAKADNVLAHRHLDLALAGLRTHPTLTETGPSRSELHRLGHGDD